jgi:TatD DNase family protein
MIIDIHAHLDLFSEKELKEVLKNAKEAKVKYIISNAVDYKTSLLTLELSKKYPMIKPALGLYPEDALEEERRDEREKDFLKFKELAIKNKEKLVAIGEIGMDFYHGKKENSKEQEKVFREQLELAKKFEIPAIIHARNAEAEVIEVLKDLP